MPQPVEEPQLNGDWSMHCQERARHNELICEEDLSFVCSSRWTCWRRGYEHGEAKGYPPELGVAPAEIACGANQKSLHVYRGCATHNAYNVRYRSGSNIR